MNGMNTCRTWQIICGFKYQYLWIKVFNIENQIVPALMNDVDSKSSEEILIRR